MSARMRQVRSSLFTVRVWPEEVDGGRVEWRGKVQCVASGDTLYFRDWTAMAAFIRDTSRSDNALDLQPYHSEEGD